MNSSAELSVPSMIVLPVMSEVSTIEVTLRVAAPSLLDLS